MMNEPQYGIGDLPAAGTVKDTDSSAICQNANGCFAADPSVTMQRVTQYQLASYYRSRLTVSPPLLYDSSSGAFSLATDATLRVNGGQLSVTPIALAGDVTGGGIGTITTTVAKLAGTPLSTTPPTVNQVLAYNGTQWAPATGGTGSGSGTVGSGTGPQIAQYATGTGTTVAGATLSGDATIAQGGALTLANSGVTVGTYNNVTVNAKGLATGGSNVAYLTAAVTSLTAGTGITLTPATITGTGTIALTTPVSIANGGTGAAIAATSGGIPYFSSTTVMGSSGALTQYGVVLGGGAGGSPTVTAAGGAGQVLTGNAGAAPTWQALPSTISSGTVNQTAYYSAATTLSSSAGLTLSGTAVTGMTMGLTGTAVGDIYYAGTGGALTRLGAGTATYVLTANGAAAAPSWTAPTGGAVSLTAGAGITLTPATITGTGTIALTTPALPLTGGTLTGNLTLNGAAPQITLANATSNWMDCGAVGLGLPAFTTRSIGTKVVLYNALGAAAADYALGVASAGTLWQSVATTGGQFQWYGGTTVAATLSGTGNLNINGTLTVGNNANPTISIVATNFTGMFAPDGSGTTGGIFLGNAAAGTAYYRNASHTFQNASSSVIYGTLAAAGCSFVGTNTNNNATAGNVGEFVTSTAAAFAAVNSTFTNVTSISLTAGDWDVEGTVMFAPAGTTQVSYMATGVSTTSATMGSLGTFGRTDLGYSPVQTGQQVSQYTGRCRFSLAATTTVYLVSYIGFTISTATQQGQLTARRVR